MNKGTFKILKLFLDHESLSVIDITSKYRIDLVDAADSVDYLCTRKLLRRQEPVRSKYLDTDVQCEITLEGRDEIARTLKDDRRFRIPLVISVIALVVSIVSLIATMLK